MGWAAVLKLGLTIEKNYTDNTYSPGIEINASENVIVEANEVVHACMGGDQECISVSVTNRFELKSNRVHDGLTEGIDVKVGSSNGIVTKNEVYNQRYRFGIYLDAWNSHEFNIDVFDNISHNNVHGFGIASENAGLIEGIKVHHNIAYKNDQRGFWFDGGGIGQTHPYKNIKLYCNTAYENGVGINITAWSGMNIDSLIICNNRIFHNTEGISTNFEMPAGQCELKNIAILNNTICENGTLKNGWGDGGINITGNMAQNILIRNNILRGNAAYTICVQPDVPAGSITIDHNFFDGFQNFLHETVGTNAVYGNPLFVDSLNKDYHLQAASPAIDKGDPDQQYNDPEDPGKPGYALYPAQGALRNDMGAYGGPFASSWDLANSVTPPSAPALVSPSNGSTGVPTTLLLGWNGPWGATSHRLQVSTSSDFSSLVIDSSNITGQSCGIRDLENNTHYYWRVKASNAGGSGTWSQIRSFTTTSLTGIKEQIFSEELRIYPLPVDDILKIDGIDKGVTTISILSQEGKVIKQIKGTGIQEIDVSELQKGAYLVKISNSKTTVTKKIVKL